MDSDELKLLGIYRVIDHKNYNTAYYEETEKNLEIIDEVKHITYKTKPRFNVEKLRAMRLRAAKESARQALSETDWYVIRFKDPDSLRPIPPVIKQYRKDIRAALKAFEIAIETQTYDELATGNNNIVSFPDKPNGSIL